MTANGSARRPPGHQDVPARRDAALADAAIDARADMQMMAGRDVLPRDGSTSDASADAGAPQSRFCGDGIRGAMTEQCDDGTGDEADGCSEDCHVRAFAALDPDAANDDGLPGARMRSLGSAPHPVAATSDGFALAIVETDPEPRVFVQRFDAQGYRLAGPAEPAADTLAVAAPNPALAALPAGRFVVAWTDTDTGSPDVALRVLDGQSGELGELHYANGTFSGPQQDPDVVWTGSELVVAWTDLFDVYVRRFDAELAPLEPAERIAESDALESGIALASWRESWAAAWRASEQGLERVYVRAGSSLWWTDAFASAAPDDRPALVALDDGHLLLVHAALVPMDQGVASELRFTLLGPETPQGLVRTEPLLPLDERWAGDPLASHRQPRAARVGARVYLVWGADSAALDRPGPTLLLQELSTAVETPDTLEQLDEHRVPIGHAPDGRPANGALAAAPWGPRGALVSAWEYPSAGPRTDPDPDIAVELRPLPFVLLPD